MNHSSKLDESQRIYYSVETYQNNNFWGIFQYKMCHSAPQLKVFLFKIGSKFYGPGHVSNPPSPCVSKNCCAWMKPLFSIISSMLGLLSPNKAIWQVSVHIHLPIEDITARSYQQTW